MNQQYFDEFRIGQTFKSETMAIEEAQIKEFALSFDPQPFHLDPATAAQSFFGGLAASGWHTAALTMRLLVQSEFNPAGGIIGAGFEELRWPRPVRPGDQLHLAIEVLEKRESKSLTRHGFVKTRITTLNQRNEAVQISVGNVLVEKAPVDGGASALPA